MKKSSRKKETEKEKYILEVLKHASDLRKKTKTEKKWDDGFLDFEVVCVG